MIFRPNFHHEGNYRHDCMKREILTVKQKEGRHGCSPINQDHKQEGEYPIKNYQN